MRLLEGDGGLPERLGIRDCFTVMWTALATLLSTVSLFLPSMVAVPRWTGLVLRWIEEWSSDESVEDIR